MKERLHEQITGELRQISRNDTTVIIIALIVTFVFGGVAMGFAANAVDHYYRSSSYSSSEIAIMPSIVMFVSLFVIIGINWFSILTVHKNKAQKIKLAESLNKLYQEENLDQYYNKISNATFDTRCYIYTAVLAIISLAGIIMPLAIYITKITI